MSEQWDILKSKISPGHLLTAKYWWQVLIYGPQAIPRVFWYIYAWEKGLSYKRDYLTAFLAAASISFFLTHLVVGEGDGSYVDWPLRASVVCMAAAFILSHLTLMFIGLTVMAYIYLAIAYTYELIFGTLLWSFAAWSYRRYIGKNV